VAGDPPGFPLAPVPGTDYELNFGPDFDLAGTIDDLGAMERVEPPVRPPYFPQSDVGVEQLNHSFIHRHGSVGLLAGQDTDGVGQQVDDGGQAFERPPGRTRKVDHQCMPPGTGDAPREGCQRARTAHGLAKPGSVAVEDLGRALRRLVPRAKAGTSGSDHYANERRCHSSQESGHRRDAIGHLRLFDHVEAGVPQSACHRRPAFVLAFPSHDGVRDGEDLGLIVQQSPPGRGRDAGAAGAGCAPVNADDAASRIR
jgi:hypothetical protein